MPRSVLILIAGAVAALGVLTWYQLFQDSRVASPEFDGSSNQVAPSDPGADRQDQPIFPVVVPRDVPLSVRALELLQALTRSMLGKGPPLNDADLAWLRGTEEGVAELRRLLETSEDDNLRAVVLLTLGQGTVNGTFETLKEAAEGDYGEKLRTAGIVAMMNGQTEAIAVLHDIFVDTRDPGVAAASLQALSHASPDLALVSFEDLLARTQDAGKRDTLYQILAGHPWSLKTDEPEVMVQFRGELPGLNPPVQDPTQKESRAIDGIVEHLEREEDPILRGLGTVILARMPGAKAEQVFMARYKAADNAHQQALLGLINPDMCRGKINALLGIAPEMKDRRQREILSMQAANWPNPNIVGELRVWRSLEEDDSIRLRLEETIRRLEGR